MKTYTFKFDLAAPTPARFKTPPWSDFAVGVKVLANGEDAGAQFSLVRDGQPLEPEADKTAGFTVYGLKSEDPGTEELKVVVEGEAQPFSLTWETSDGNTFETGSGSGGDSPAADAYRETTYDTKVVYQDTENRTFVLSSFTFEGEVSREDIPMPDGFLVREIIFGTGVSAVGDNACSGMTGLQYVKLPKTVVRVGDCAFMGSFLARLDWEQESGIMEHATKAGTSN